MKNLLLIILAVFPLIAAEEKKEFRWLKFNDADSIQNRTKKIIILNLYTNYCGWCRKMNTITYGDSNVIKIIEDGFLPVMIDIRSNDTLRYKGKTYTEREFAALVGIRGTPTTGFIDSTKNLVVKVPGYVPPSSFIYLLKYVKGGWYKDMTFDEFYKSEKELEKRGR